MPWAPKRPCTHPGCRELTDGGKCARHRREEQREYNLRRGSSARQGYGSRWRRAREIFLAAHPLCEACLCEGRTVAATVVDHIRPHRGSPELFWDEDNWQALCKSCHDRKTVRDGRWGGGSKSLEIARA